jgi:hypothetical protein
MLVAATRRRHQVLGGGPRYLRRTRLSSFRRFERRHGDPELDAIPVQHDDVQALRARALRSRRHPEPSAVQRVPRIGDGHLFIEGGGT